jgi:hypothetical protein
MGLIAMVLMATTAIVYGASLYQYHGHAWADSICSVAPLLCASPNWLAMTTVAFSIVYFYRLSVDS